MFRYRHCFDADPDLTFQFDAEPDPEPDPTPSFTHVGKTEKILLLFTLFNSLVNVIVVTILNTFLAVLLKFSGKR